MTTTEQPRARRLSALAAPLLIAVVIQSAGNLLYHAVVGRTLPAADYGALGSVLAAMTLVAVPLSALQTAAARTAAALGASRQTAARALLRTALWISPFVVLLAVGAPAISDYLHLESAVDAGLLAPTVLAAALVAVGRGLLLGTSRSVVVASSYVLATVVRLGPGLFLALQYGVTGALVGTLLGELSGLALVMWAALRAAPGPLAAMTIGEVGRVTAVVTGLFVFTTVDLFLARHFLAGSESGTYVAAATIGKTVLALPAAALSIAFPRMVSSWQAQAQPGAAPGIAPAALRSAVIVVGVPAIAAGFVVAAVPALVLTVLYGSDTFPDAAPLVRALSVIAALSAFVSIMAHAGLARNSFTSLLPWLGATLEIVLIEVWHGTAMAIAMGSGVALTATLLVLAAMELPAWRRAGRAAGGTPREN
jgi:O-antigen/teichoic acid export membrane protein